MRKKERYDFVISTLEKKFGVMDTELSYTSPFELLIATVLSAQCTDKRVNMITPSLFRDYPTPKAMALAEPDVIFEYIRSVSYPNSKAKYLVGIGKALTERFAGEVPPRFLVSEPWMKLRYDEVLARIEKRMEERGTWQGRLYT